MKDFTVWREAAQHENVLLHRGLAVFGGLAAGAAAVAVLAANGWSGLNPAGVIGPTALGWVQPQQGAAAVLMLLGASLGAGAAWGLWLLLAWCQGRLGGVPQAAALKRAAAPFVVFLPLLTQLIRGQAEPLWPLIAFAVFSAGVLWLAFLERGDKRKIYFAHPTEADYHPAAVFTHGGVIALGAGLGWYLQSLPQGTAFLSWGMWFPVLTGLAVWLAALGLGGVLGFLYTKHTFNQSFHAVALATLPLALLPIQAASWVSYFGVDGGGFRLSFLPVLLPILAFGGGFTVLILALLNLSRRPVEIQPAWEELFHALMLIAAVPLLLFAAAFWPAGSPMGQSAVAGSLDLLREGEPLASAQAVLFGRLPFKEILFRHGFLTDAVSGLAALGWFGPNVESLRLLLTWLTPLGAVALYLLAIFCLPWAWALLLALVLLTGNLGRVAETHFFFAYVGFIFTLLYLQRQRWPVLLLSGLATVLALISSFSAGLLALSGHLALLLAFLAVGPAESGKRLQGLAVYLGAVLAGMVPWWIYLALSGSLGAYFANFGWVLANNQAIFGLALPGWGAEPSIWSILLFALPPAAVLLGLLNLAGALDKARERGLPWNVLLLTVVSFLMWLRFLQRGSFEFLLEALPVSVMLLAFTLYRQSAHNPRLRGGVFLVALLALFIPRAGALDLPQLAGRFGLKNRIATDGLERGGIPALGGAFLPPQQAKDVTALAEFLEGQVGSAEAFFDFSNQPLLYFLVPRRPVVRALTTATLATFEQQVDAIRDLSDAKVKAVVYGVDPKLAVAGVPAVVRQYALSEYLLGRFSPATVKGGSVVLVPREENPAPSAEAAAALQQNVALGDLPYRWGRLSKYDPSQGGAAGGFTPADGIRSVEPAGLTVTVQGDALEIGSAAGEVILKLAGKPDPAQPANVLVLTLKAPAWLDGETAVLAWGDKAAGRSVSFRLHGDGEFHPYAFRVGALPSWVLAGEVTALRLTLPGGGWAWSGAKFLAVHDLPEKARPKAPAAPAPDKKK